MPSTPDPALPLHSRAVIISSGDEIILGQLLDTNAQRIASALVSRGVLPVEHISIPDALPAIVAALQRAAQLAPLVILSGGLGPTDGDLTRAALAELTGDQLVLDQDARADIATLLAKRGREMTARQERQAYRPSRARCLPNHLGTAPGLHMLHENVDIFALPGPPGELIPMLDREVMPRLRTDPTRTVLTQLAHIVGIPEADCVTKLGDLTKRTNMPLVGITASGGVLTLRIRYEGQAPHADALHLINQTITTAREKLGDHLFSPPRCPDASCLDAFPSSQKTASKLTDQAHPTAPGSELLIRTLLDHLIHNNQTLATAESCTGGMLGELITAVPGSSAAYLGGFVTYANTLKEHIGVDPTTLKQNGAVSAPVAQQMATRARESTKVTYALSITGIAGPDGGTADKPVGTVHIALSGPSPEGGAKGSSPEGGGMFVRSTNAEGAEGRTTTGPAVNPEPPTPQSSPHSRHFLFTGDREDIRRRAAISALTMLYFHLKGHPPSQPHLLWELPQS